MKQSYRALAVVLNCIVFFFTFNSVAYTDYAQLHLVAGNSDQSSVPGRTGSGWHTGSTTANRTLIGSARSTTNYHQLVQRNKLHQQLMSMNADDFCALMQEKNISGNELFKQHQLYKYPGYLQLLRQQPAYKNEMYVLYSTYIKLVNRIIGVFAGIYTPGVIAIVREEIAHIRAQEAEEKQRLAREQCQARDAIAHTIELNRDQLGLLLCEWQRYPHLPHLQKRAQALTDLLNNQSLYQQCQYHLNTDAQHVYASDSELIALLTTCYGNRLQQVIHQELITLANLSADSQLQLTLNHYFDSLFVDTLKSAAQANKVGCIEESIHLSDICRGLIDIVGGLVTGSLYSLQDSLHSLSLQTLINLMKNAATLLFTCAKAIGAVSELGYYYVADNDRFYLRYKEINDYRQALGECAQAKYNSASCYQLARDGTRFAAGICLGPRVAQLTFRTCVALLPFLARYRRCCTIEAASMVFEPEYALITIPGTNTPAQCMISDQLQTIANTVATVHKNIVKAQFVLGPSIPPISAYLFEVDNHALVLSNFFNGKCKWIIGDKYLTIDVKHLFGMELTSVKDYIKMGGFHHDYLGQLEKTGAIQVKIMKELRDGFYKAEIEVNGIKTSQPKTFFPKHWTRQEVLEYIGDVYNDSIKKGILPEKQSNGKFLLDAQCSNGMELRFYITQDNVINTVYPYF